MAVNFCTKAKKYWIFIIRSVIINLAEQNRIYYTLKACIFIFMIKMQAHFYMLFKVVGFVWRQLSYAFFVRSFGCALFILWGNL